MDYFFTTLHYKLVAASLLCALPAIADTAASLLALNTTLGGQKSPADKCNVTHSMPKYKKQD